MVWNEKSRYFNRNNSVNCGYSIILFWKLPGGESIDSLQKDYDGTNFKSYNDGDLIVIKGKITSQLDSTMDNQKVYEIQFDNSNLTVLSTQYVPSDGSDVLVELQITSLDGKEVPQVHIIYEKSAMIYYIGIGLFFIGIIVIIIGAVLKPKDKTKDKQKKDN